MQLLTTIVSIMIIISGTALGASNFELKELEVRPSAGGTVITSGRFVIKPSISAQTRYDSNYYRSEDNELDRMTYLLQPGIIFGYETDRTAIKLDYTLNAHFYSDIDDETNPSAVRDDDDFLGHTFRFNVVSTMTDHVSVKFYEHYFRTQDPTYSNRFSEAIPSDDIIVNQMSPSFLYRFDDRFTAGLSYVQGVYRYDRHDVADADQDKGIFDLFYSFSERSDLNLKYETWKKDYDEPSSDFTSNKMSLSYRKQFYYLSVDVGGGYHIRDFDEDDLDTIETASCYVHLTMMNPPYAVERPKTRVDLTLERDITEHANYADDYYISSRGILKALYSLTETLVCKFNGSYQLNEYEKWEGIPGGSIRDREDEIYSLSLGLNYYFTDFTKFSATGGYEERDSNLFGYDFENLYVLGEFSYKYDFGK